MSLLLRLRSLSSYPRFLPPSSSSSHRRPPFSPTSLHIVITPLPITFPLFTIASPPSHPFPSHLGSSLYSFPITTFSTPTIAHGDHPTLAPYFLPPNEQGKEIEEGGSE
ncbi:unnamed protein product [Closterium sp. NIES-64]|nr:unnamed protein product [Closterium sp. NIES-64]